VPANGDFYKKLTTKDFGRTIQVRSSDGRGIPSLDGTVLRWSIDVDVPNASMYYDKARQHMPIAPDRLLERTRCKHPTTETLPLHACMLPQMRPVPRVFHGGLGEYAGAFEHLLLEEVRAGVEQELQQAGSAAVYEVGINRVGCTAARGMPAVV
jgi:hypothetical protein